MESDSDCKGKFLDLFLSPEMLRLAIMLHFCPPGMLLGEICIPFLAVTLHGNALILLHDYQ